MFKTLAEAQAAFASHKETHEQFGAILPSVRTYLPEPWKRNWNLAMDSLPELGFDAQPGLSTDPSSSIPALLTTMIDPAVYKIIFAPNKAAAIFGENRKGTWIDDVVMFPTVEYTGEVSSYGDYNENGSTGANTNFPQRQSYLYQTIKEYGDREIDRAGLARINWVSELDAAAATNMNKFQNFTYFFGVAGLQNYGLFNDPNLSASLTPSTKAAGGTKWINSSGQIVATANEIYLDIESLFIQLVSQTAGAIDRESSLTLAISPTSDAALTATNSFNVNVSDLLKKNFPNLKVMTAVQYGAQSTANPQGVAAGNFAQLIADAIEGQDVGYCSFNEKLRAHPIIRATSSYKQKQTGGTWGAVIRLPMGFASMLGI